MSARARRGYVYAKGRRLYVAWYDVDGRRHLTATGLEVGQEEEAARRLRALQDQVEAMRAVGAGAGPLTVQRWATKWIERRERRGVAMVRDERQRLRAYIGPALGDIPLGELTRRQVVSWVDELRGRLAPRSVLHVYGTLRQMMATAAREGLIDATPCTLEGDELPRLEDRDPEWRQEAVFTREELERLISDPDIPEDRRVAYALMGLAGLRWGEVAALRWRAYDRTLEPLGQLVISVALSERHGGISRTKTGAVRRVPVHPTLATLLARWKLLQCDVAPDDLIVPGHEGKPRRNGSAYKSLQVDLRARGMRPRRLHDFRRTMVSLAQAGGADPSVIRWITHTPARSDMIALYTSLPWATLCSAVSRIRCQVLEGEVIPLRKAAGAATALLPPESGKGKAPDSLTKSGASMVGTTGFESVSAPHLEAIDAGVSAGKSGVYRRPPGSHIQPETSTLGASGSNAATDPEEAIRAALEDLEPSAARALLLRLLAELG